MNSAPPLPSILPGGFSEKLEDTCIVVLLQTGIYVEFTCLHKQTEEGKKERGEETDSQDLDEPWEKRALVEEKQKCLRTFLCDYTVLDKSRHSCSHFVHWALR